MTGEDEREREQEVFDKGENFYEVTWVDEGMRLHAMAITATPMLWIKGLIAKTKDSVHSAFHGSHHHCPSSKDRARIYPKRFMKKQRKKLN